MSTFTSEPGTRLGGRYRLEDRVAAAAGWAAWKAIDETLARAVTVLTFAPGFPRLREVVMAARAASRLNDSRFAQVFDVEDDWDHAYIVTEWAAGDSLDDLLAAGPLDAARGARIIAEAAEAISVAHAAGLAHLCLGPESLRWTPGGGVKITGLGIDAALSGATAEDPAFADTRRLGMLLYAALTGHWPGPDCPTLPPAPFADGVPCSPRQVRAGVPAALDEITCEILMLRDQDGESRPTTPAQLSTALFAAIPPVPIPQLPPPPRTRADGNRPGQRATREPDNRSRGGREADYGSGDGQDQGYWSPDGPPPGGRTRGPAPGRRRPASSRAKLIIAAVAVIALILIVAVLYPALRGGSGKPNSSTQHPPATTHSSSAPAVLKPLSAHGFGENDSFTNLAIDNNPTTDWQTHWYIGNPVFGGLQKGSGLILDMGRTVRLSSVEVTFGPLPGADVQIKIGNPSPPLPGPDNASGAAADAASMTTVAQKTDVAGAVTFTVSSKASGRYVLIWFTKLPPMTGHNPNKFQADIFNVVVKGSS